jgi:hypothetical protein
MKCKYKYAVDLGFLLLRINTPSGFARHPFFKRGIKANKEVKTVVVNSPF